jgi:hypothetical protein
MKHANKVNMQFVYTPAASTNVGKTIARTKLEECVMWATKAVTAPETE